jgi:hypothetical protein
MVELTTAQTAAFAGCISSTLLSGINLSASQLTLPILYRLPSTMTPDIFEELFYRGGWIIVPLTIFSTIASGLAAYNEPSKRFGYIVAAVTSFASMPWTAIIMRPTIQHLIKLAHDEKYCQSVPAADVVALLRRWTWMNNVRSTLALIGGCTALAVLLGRF